MIAAFGHALDRAALDVIADGGNGGTERIADTVRSAERKNRHGQALGRADLSPGQGRRR